MMIDLATEFRGRDVLVTGADGFLGSHLVEALTGYGAHVRALVRATSSGGLRNISHLIDRITVIRGDLTDKHSTERLLRALKTETSGLIVFHLAAQAHVGESWERPYETFTANTIGTLNLLQSIVDVGIVIEKFDTAGTSEEYGNVNADVRHLHEFDANGHLVLHERSPINPKSIYATSKVAADFLTMNYYDAYGVPGVVTRMFNNYGPRQNPRYITGTVITQALERETISLGSLDPLRDFCYCEDGVRGHLTVALAGRPGDVYVYGQGRNIAIGEWAEMILKIGQDAGYWRSRSVKINPDRFRPGSSEVNALRVGYEKLARETGWSPIWSWEDGLKKTIDWYRAHREQWIGRVDWHERAMRDTGIAQ